MIRSVRELPPGSVTIFAVEVDNFGNETYVGGPVTYGGLDAISDGEDGGAAGGTIPPSYATPPIPRTSTPVDTEYAKPPGGRNLDVVVKDGLSLEEATPESIEAIAGQIEGTGWVNPDNVRTSDDNNAYIDASAGGYCNTLELSEFDMSALPPNATIVGIKVTVERSKL